MSVDIAAVQSGCVVDIYKLAWSFQPAMHITAYLWGDAFLHNYIQKSLKRKASFNTSHVKIKRYN